MSPTPRVVGLGGVFIKARDPKLVRDWYRRHLGLDIDENYGGCMLPLNEPVQPKAYSVFSVFDEGTRYFDPIASTSTAAPTQEAGAPRFMINFRVADLDGLVAALRAEGCTVADTIDRSEYGDFCWVMDPEGQRIELWQPPA